jgi:predicted nucleotidyltransferase
MTRKKTALAPTVPVQYQSPDIPMSAIRRYARQIAERFQPDRIILFGSFADGTPREGSDVDLLVVMPAPREITQAIRISCAIDAPSKEKGKVLYEKRNGALGQEG